MIWIAVAAAAAILLVLLVINLTTREKVIRQEILHRFGVDDPQFALEMSVLLGPSLLPGNSITPFYNGDQIFPAMLGAIRGARRSITFETYIYWSGEVGKAFSEALSERARAGVRVHVMLDWVGSGQMDEAMLDAMRGAGVELEKYHPLRWYNIGRLNNRTHRKLLVVDGAIGFTGGVGIADKWEGHAQDIDHWRDSHFRLTGPAVAQMQSAFIDNWLETRGTVLLGPDYFPPLVATGSQQAQVFRSSATDASESVRLMYLLSIASAKTHIRLASSYFVPDALAIRGLLAASRRGVSVQILVPGNKIDAVVVRWASRGMWGPMLEAGITICEFQPTMYHVKVMVVDEYWTSVGSTNFDDRSFRLNDEANLNILDRDVAREQIRKFDEDRAKSRAVTLAMWRRRPWPERLRDWLAGRLRPQL